MKTLSLTLPLALCGLLLTACAMAPARDQGVGTVSSVPASTVQAPAQG